MNTVTVLLMLSLLIHADGLEGPTAGCTFDEDSNPDRDRSQCKQGKEDDFDWQLIRSYSWPHANSDLLRGSFMLVNASQHASGQRAHLLLRALSENDTHCVQFSYFLYSRDGHSPGTLRVYVRVNGGPLGNPVWNVSGSHGRQWHQVELAVSTFWPNDYQVSSPCPACTASAWTSTNHVRPITQKATVHATFFSFFFSERESSL
ncbi:receptor-type tyrosine-protein phosphatase U [Anguilla rostrata]|uniref:receptor-type tyrosine-protein phosphatase U n=1 Tax=Anguilla rostrata TaxID=7938 RepID=UPI0030CFE915